ncbi:CA074 protein, partial [Amia calva]|nr:CA074 protein [Amia calva]
MSAAPPADLLVSLAQQCLQAGPKKKKTKRLPPSVCLDLAAQILVVDSGLKPAYLYDVNCAGPEQICLYLDGLYAAGLLTGALHVLPLDGSVLVLSVDRAILRLEELLLKDTVAIVDVSLSRSAPAIAGPESGVRELTLDTVADLRIWRSGAGRDKPPQVISLSEAVRSRWNLCTLFGILLGYPATYWFERDGGSDSCLSMVPLRVRAVSASCPAIAPGFRAQICSFSVPDLLTPDTRGAVDCWTRDMQEKFSQQLAFTDISLSTETIALPSVAL